MDLSLLGLMLLGLVIAACVIELLVEHLEESLGGVGKVLKEKVFKERALLGIVSFAALVSIHLPISMNHNIFLVFELAHVLMFAMALVFSTLGLHLVLPPDDLQRLGGGRPADRRPVPAAVPPLELSGSASGVNVLFPEISQAWSTT